VLSFVQLGGLAFVAASLLATGGAHLIGLPGFARLLRQHGLLPGVLATPLAVVVTGTELAIALAALAGSDPRFGPWLGTTAFAASLAAGGVFLAYLRRLRRSGHSGSCGCSPLASPLTPASFAPAAFLATTGALGLLARWAAAPIPLSLQAWSGLAIAWGVTLAGVVLLLPASAPGKVLEVAP
jgi:hypothetical protein